MVASRMLAAPRTGKRAIGRSAVAEMSIASVSHQTAIHAITDNVTRPAWLNVTISLPAERYCSGSTR